MEGELTGRCICGSVSYTLRSDFRPYACHCTDCQSRSGSGFSEHLLFARQDLVIEGELDSGSYQQPSGATSTMWGCAKCKVRVFSENNIRVGFASLRCGTLDRSSEIVLAAHLWIGSKQPWIVIPNGVPMLHGQPRTQAEWVALVGPLGT